MNFKKELEKIFNNNSSGEGYISFKKINVCDEINDISRWIENYIKTDYFVWKEKNLEWIFNNKKINTRIRGFYDANTINENDFIKVSKNYFIQYFLLHIQKEINDFDIWKKYFISTLNILNNDIDDEFFLLEINDKKNSYKVSKFSPFDFFYSGLIINYHKKYIIDVEFGYD